MEPKKASKPASLSVPAEWVPQKAIWTAWPSAANLWLENLMPARAEVAGMIAALAGAGRVNVLVMGDEARKAAEDTLRLPNVNIVPADFGDIWLRDTGPIFVLEDGRKTALTFRFNGWGGKYELPHDEGVSSFIAAQSGASVRPYDFVLEGGALEHDGAGCILTTRECLLNPNRNPGLSQQDIEEKLKTAFGAERIVWLGKGLMNDHTDGHIDNIARFAAPGHVICQSPSGRDDPNARVLDDISLALRAEGFKVTRIPSPGLVTDEDGAPVAASHMNYIIFNDIIVMPVYEAVHGEAAAEALRGIFPRHDVIALPARHVLTGGGSFHCITQQEPI